ncbi:hypothetical protein Ari01nite_51850 [Paractinoplanes rishiriensis]|uniref:Uncharacterized protein n=1 Tax=Paractinoplanes rishiriensis TaxID=1050105 RepID=A0A919K2B4_9ACTN|nr:hypothetical protein Ari01nite_51850 [Actinoplanes rishiriensis]
MSASAAPIILVAERLPGIRATAAFANRTGDPTRIRCGRDRPTAGGPEADWRADVLDRLAHAREFRTPRPVRARSGQWVVDGWEALQWVPGAADEKRVSDVIRAGAAFHRAVAGLARPAFIDTSDDPWACADRMSRLPCIGTVVPRPSGWRMMWWLPLTLAILKPCRSSARIQRANDPGAGGRREAEASGSHGDRKLPRNAELLDQADERIAEIFQCGFLGVTLAMCTHSGTQLGVSAPDAVLVALDDYRHGHGAKLGYEGTIARQ